MRRAFQYTWLEKVRSSVSTMTLIYIHMYCVPWRRKNAPNVTIHAQEVYMGMCLLATNLILSPEFHFRYEKVPLICRRLLMPIGDDHGNVKGYFIPNSDGLRKGIQDDPRRSNACENLSTRPRHHVPISRSGDKENGHVQCNGKCPEWDEYVADHTPTQPTLLRATACQLL